MTNPSTTDNGKRKPPSATSAKSLKSPKKPLKLTAPKQQKGAQFERLACQYLQQQGLTLIAQNWHQPKVGEIDLIMSENKAWPVLIFIEVRCRSASRFGDAMMSVTPAKQRKVIKTAQYFLQQHPKYADFECRFDVVAYDGDNADRQPEWLQSAFMAAPW